MLVLFFFVTSIRSEQRSCKKSSSDSDSSRGIRKGGSFPFHKKEWRRTGDFNCQGNRKSGEEKEIVIVRVIQRVRKNRRL